MQRLIETIDKLDERLFLMLNGLHHPFFDFFMIWASDRFIWIPFYGFLVFLIVKKFKWDSIYIVITITILLISTDQITSSFFKPFFERFRPCHDPLLKDSVHLVRRCGSQFGFVSSHAANTFALAAFLWLIFRNIYKMVGLLFIWAGIISYSRIYLGVHFPGDVIIGALIGILLSVIFYQILYWLLNKRKGSDISYASPLFKWNRQ